MKDKWTPLLLLAIFTALYLAYAIQYSAKSDLKQNKESVQ